MSQRLLEESEITIRPKSRTHRWRLIRAGQFPRPIKIGTRNFWVADEIEAFETARIAAGIAARDSVTEPA